MYKVRHFMEVLPQAAGIATEHIDYFQKAKTESHINECIDI